jgi:hypothetical protein
MDISLASLMSLASLRKTWWLLVGDLLWDGDLQGGVKIIVFPDDMVAHRDHLFPSHKAVVPDP